ncbi:uncharacterized protein [Nicotiana tomentosiformis]|uniref:uncharacterized protein n=1 Tax=Nicotiana tomentosiformis TaxID=4098 RepID=UPI00388CC259
MDRTIVEKGRNMLIMAILPKLFCGEVVQIACYLINRSPSVQLDFEIPERVWTNKEVSNSHLKIWRRRIGVPIRDLVKKKVIRSRDVVFRKGEVGTAHDILEKLSKKICPTTMEQKGNMARIPYSSAVRSLMYAMVCTRPDIAYAVGIVSRFLENSGKEHWEEVKWILRYLRGAFVDWGAISWQSKLQKCIVLSTIEAEYIALLKLVKRWYG